MNFKVKGGRKIVNSLLREGAKKFRHVLSGLWGGTNNFEKNSSKLSKFLGKITRHAKNLMRKFDDVQMLQGFPELPPTP